MSVTKVQDDTAPSETAAVSKVRAAVAVVLGSMSERRRVISISKNDRFGYAKERVFETQKLLFVAEWEFRHGRAQLSIRRHASSVRYNNF